MKFEDEIYVGKTEVVPAGSYNYKGFLKNYNIGNLIDKLNEKEIGIIPEYCEQTIEYKLMNEKKKTIVPLQAYFTEDVQVLGYNLRSENLEIELNNYFETSKSMDYKGDSKFIKLSGGPRFVKVGVSCSIKLEGNYEEGKKVEIVKNVLKDCYK
jgi:hypothetical protein